MVVVSATDDGRWSAREQATLPAVGENLRTVPWSCPAPIEAVFLLGGRDVGTWPACCDWKREWGYNDNFKGRDVVQEFERWRQAQHPLYSGDSVAVAGGWHFHWPGDDWLEPVDDELVLGTLDSEPYLDVWKDKRGYEIRPRTS